MFVRSCDDRDNLHWVAQTDCNSSGWNLTIDILTFFLSGNKETCDDIGRILIVCFTFFIFDISKYLNAQLFYFVREVGVLGWKVMLRWMVETCILKDEVSRKLGEYFRYSQSNNMVGVIRQDTSRNAKYRRYSTKSKILDSTGLLPWASHCNLRPRRRASLTNPLKVYKFLGRRVAQAAFWDTSHCAEIVARASREFRQERFPKSAHAPPYVAHLRNHGMFSGFPVV